MFFNNAEQYLKKAIIQRLVAYNLVLFSKTELLKSDKILDIGCGTGFVGEHISKIYTNKILHGLDQSQEMITTASKYYTNVFKSKIEDFNLLNYNLILSSMCLQWVPNLNTQLTKLNKIADLCFAIPIEGNLKEVNQAFEKCNIQSPLLKNQNLIIKPSMVACYKEKYHSILSLLKCFNNIGAINKNAKRLSHTQIKNVEMHFHGEVNWKIGFFKIQKNSLL